MTSKKLKLGRFDIATRHASAQYNDYDEIDCTDCMVFGGSATHELILRNPNAVFIVANEWDVESFKHLMAGINEDDRVTDKPHPILRLVKPS